MSTVMKGSNISFCVVLLLMFMPLLGHAVVANGGCGDCIEAFWAPPGNSPPLDVNRNPDFDNLPWSPFNPGDGTEFAIGTDVNLSLANYFGLKNNHDPDNFKRVWMVIKPIETKLMEDDDTFEYLTDLNFVGYSGVRDDGKPETIVDLENVVLTSDGNIRIDWRIPICPDWEIIGIGLNPDTNVMYFRFEIIDFGADCVPEPATLSLVGLGIAGLAARRYRQSKK